MERAFKKEGLGGGCCSSGGGRSSAGGARRRGARRSLEGHGGAVYREGNELAHEFQFARLWVLKLTQ